MFRRNFQIEICFFVFAVNVFAQHSSNKETNLESEILARHLEEVYLIQIEIPFINQSETSQEGNLNSTRVLQINPDMAEINYANIKQNGNNNFASLSQSGSGNLSYVEQDGLYNDIEMSLDGNNLAAFLGQYGDGNMIRQNLSGEELSFILIQNGNDNSLIQIEDGTAAINYTVIQNGNGMNVQIIRSNIFRN